MIISDITFKVLYPFTTALKTNINESYLTPFGQYLLRKAPKTTLWHKGIVSTLTFTGFSAMCTNDRLCDRCVVYLFFFIEINIAIDTKSI